MTNSSETPIVSYIYDGYGNLVASSGTSANVYGFTGEQQFNEADNMVYLRARYYQPSFGRFVKYDPIGKSTNSGHNLFSPLAQYTDSMSLYIYVKNNPINLTDPYGLVCGDKYTDRVVPDRYGAADFSGACQRHDDCYSGFFNKGDDRCHTPPSKHECDIELFNNLHNECKRAYAGNNAMRKKCTNRAFLYYKVVRDLGQKPFNRARNIK